MDCSPAPYHQSRSRSPSPTDRHYSVRGQPHGNSSILVRHEHDSSPIPSIGHNNYGRQPLKIIEPEEHQTIQSPKISTYPHLQKPRSRSASPSNDAIVAYIPDLPPAIDDSHKLEEMIRQCLKRKHKLEVVNIKCSTHLGIGIVYLQNNKEKEHLIDVVKSIIVDSQEDTIIKFASDLELISYVVIESTDDKNLPSSEDVAQRWVKFYKANCPLICEPLSVQFPNIFRIVSDSLDQLMKAMTREEFSINGQIATVHFRADCCFFEDLPRNTNADQLRHAITTQLSQKDISKASLYIQYNKEAANAVVLTYGSARKWALFGSVDLGGRVIMKKNSLVCRLLVRPIPKDFPISLIQEHKTFDGTVVKTTLRADRLILELSNKSVYQRCIDQGALRVRNHAMYMEVYTFSSNPEDSEIDAENWYETEMCDHKPNIMPFVENPQHSIFRLKWNSQAFLEQFRRFATTNSDNVKGERDRRGTETNQKRHLLRMTVMLNTIGVVWKESYSVDEREIKLKLDRLQTIVYDHRSKLQRGTTMPLSTVTNFPYTSTLIEVVNEDCMYVYQQLVAQKRRPVLLNMANADSAGGGYRKGDGAQEETLFRRSNYFRSLDIGLDIGKPTSRFYCNSNSELEPLSETQTMYSMDEFGAIYTSGLTFFRLAEDTGYTFMSEPLSDVCAIAMAAYREPKVENNQLVSKFSIGMRKKIENIFAIAYHHKHDCLVLSALGCGAFKNPPKHIAAIFKSVAEQYAGFFKSICFAIVDDHNTGLQLNPQGNYGPFKQLLHGNEIKPKEYKMQGMMVGPWKILDMPSDQKVTLSDMRISYLKPCHYGGKCNDLQNAQHCREYSHPPLCPSAGSATPCKLMHDEDHLLWFTHRSKCQYGVGCRLLLQDSAHSNEFEHPQFCREGGRCESMDPEHLKTFRHVPLCEYGMTCLDYNKRNNSHCREYRHCKPVCPHAHFCVRFHDQKHIAEKSHPFPPPCPFTPFHCRQYTLLSESTNIRTLSTDVQNHCLQFSHVCRFGRQCCEALELHWDKTIHIARKLCPYEDKCTKTNQEEHLNSFAHPNIADIRRLCVRPAYECQNRRKHDHIVRYRHGGNYDRSGVIRYFGLNTEPNFVENQQNIIAAINEYTKKPLLIPPAIPKWIRGLQPVHRCGKLIFESILVHGHVMSREHMEHLKKPHFVAQAVQQHKRVRAIFDLHKNQTIEDQAKDYIKAIVAVEYEKTATVPPLLTTGTATSVVHEDYNSIIRAKEKILNTMLSPEDVDVISRCAIEIAEASLKLHSTPAGIGYAPDKALGTDKHVFSVLGPNLGHYYGDIIIVFKSELMHHPDANFSSQAATSFASGSVFKHQPWLIDSNTVDGRVKQFHKSKLHRSVPGYEYAAAASIVALAETKQKITNVDLKDIHKYWKSVDSHQVFEAHLPQLIPLDYIEEVYIPKNLFASLIPAAQESAKMAFPDSLRITPHEIELNKTGGGGSNPSDKGRSDYQHYVIEKLFDKFDQRIEHSPHFHGTVITVAPSQFLDHIVLPLTISQVAKQHHSKHKKHSTDDAYIYWQSMYGDVMITLSDEPIDPDSKQPDLQYLVCYIAERPSSTTSDYRESHSYLNCGAPYRHGINQTTRTFASSSNTFHRGCNTDDFLTYCLHIQRKTGQVTLSHAGPNSIYNYETISYTFPKSTLNLSRLDYIHVSAGSQKVPVRNLEICFERVSDLHPSFDKEFKRASAPFPDIKNVATAKQTESTATTSPSDVIAPSIVSQLTNTLYGFFGIGSDHNDTSTKLVRCPHSINCPLQKDAEHTKTYSHPCQYAELCRKKGDEPHLTHDDHAVDQCSMNKLCKKLDNPIHRGKYRHDGMADFLIPCPHQEQCQNKSYEHRIKFSHGEQVEIITTTENHFTSHNAPPPPIPTYIRPKPYGRTPDYGQQRERTPCRHGLECRDIDNVHHCSTYSHPSQQEFSHLTDESQQRMPCRQGFGCRDKHDTRHCSQYSHIDKHGVRSSIDQGHHRLPCRHGLGCREKHNVLHCSEYTHPDEQHHRSRGSDQQKRIACRHGVKCRDSGDLSHCSKYSHPDE